MACRHAFGCRCLARYGMDNPPDRQSGLAATVTFASFINTAMEAMQRALLGRRVARTQLVEAPIFIVGHWRSGTTLLQELMVLDDRFTCPTTYQCFAPNHFLVSAWWVSAVCGFCCRRNVRWIT